LKVCSYWVCLLLLILRSTASAVPLQKPIPHETVLVLDEAVRALGNPSLDYSVVMKRALSKLPAGEDSVKNGINRFLSRAPAPGSDFKCGAEFLRRRARGELVAMRDALLNSTAEAVQPEVCYALPFAVDMSRLPNAIEIYGYDLDQISVEMFLVSPIAYTDVSFALSLRTHYHLTFNLRDRGLEFLPNSELLGVTWGHLIHHSIPLIQPETRLCASKIEEIDPNTITYSPLRINVGVASAGAAATVSADVALEYKSNGVAAMVCATDLTVDGGQRSFGGCATQFLFTIDPDRTIEFILGRVQSRITYTSRKENKEVKVGGRGEAVERWTFATEGFTDPQLTIRFNKIRLVSTDTAGCVSAISYLEAKRVNGLSPATVRALDPQLSKVNSAILKVRPRFAP